MSVLVHRSVTRTLFTMAFPMLAGTFAMNAYNLTDTYFVSRLGKLPLAAMGFSFPVVMLLTFIAGGIGTGVTTLVAHSIGRHDHLDARRLCTQGIAMVVAVALALSVVGYFTIGPVFRQLGADEATLPLIGQYMRIWYIGAALMAVPMLGNGILISAGDSANASRFMILGTVLNLILDPIMIFGYFGCPAMGIAGAALATVIARALAIIWLFDLLIRKHRLFSLSPGWLTGLLVSARRIMRFAIPSILSMMLMPISAAVITRLLSGYGVEAVAASGAAGRIEMFAFVIPMALGMSLTPFVSQNFGANRVDRIREAQKVAFIFALAYGGFIAIVFFIAAPYLAAVFTDDAKTSAVLISYIRIIAFGYGMMEVHRYCGFFLTGLHKPNSATALNAIRVLVLLVPLSFLGAYLWQINGIFIGRLVTDIVVGAIGIVWVTRISRHFPSHPPTDDEIEPVADVPIA